MAPYSLLLRLAGRISLTVVCWNLSMLYYWFHIPNSFNWYISAIVLFYVTAPFYMRLLRRCRNRELLTVGSFLVSYALYWLVNTVGVGYLSDVLLRIPSFAMGALIGSYLCEPEDSTRKMDALMAVLAVLGAGLAAFGKLSGVYIHPCYRFNCFVLPICLLFCLFFQRLKENCMLKRALALIGTYSLEIYLLNVIFTREFDTFRQAIPVLQNHVTIPYAIFYAVNLLGGIGIGKAIHGVQARIAARKKN